MKYASISLILSLTPCFTYADNREQFLVINPHGNASSSHTWPGFFAEFLIVVGALDRYEKEGFGGCGVEFNWGLYHDSSKGPNWWEYFFKPININPELRKNARYLSEHEKAACAWGGISSISRERAYELITRYIHIKPHIQQKIDDFIAEHFADHFVIGLHYRGTDKYEESPRMSYNEVYQKLEELIELHKDEDYRIFLATDDANFIDYLTAKIEPGRLCYRDTIRSRNGQPIHRTRQIADAYQLGEEVLIDSVLFSRCSILIRMHSNVSSTAGNFNPTLPMITLNVPYARKQFPSLR